MPIVYEKCLEISPVAPEVEVGLDFYYQTANLRKVSADTHAFIQKKNQNPDWNRNLIQHYKKYHYAEKIVLKDDLTKCNTLSFVDAILNRRSERQFSGEATDLITLANILKMAYGASANGKRTAPSGGGCYPIELYVTAFNIQGLKPGVYHYNPIDFTLDCIRVPEDSSILRQELMRIYESDSLSLSKCNVVLTMTGIYERTVQQKYKNRGWRLLFLDAGHLGENIALSSQACGLSSYTISGGWDYEIPNYLRLDRSDELHIMSYVIGKSASPKPAEVNK